MQDPFFPHSDSVFDLSPQPDRSPSRWSLVGLATLCFVVAFVFFAIFVIPGCTAPTAAQLQGASGTLTSTGAALQGASTQPSALSTGVAVVEAVAPITTPYLTLAGVALSAIGVVIGAIGGSKTTASKYATAINEIVNDVAEYKQPGVSYTANTEKLIADVAGVVAAAPVVPTAVVPTAVVPTAVVPTAVVPTQVTLTDPAPKTA